MKKFKTIRRLFLSILILTLLVGGLIGYQKLSIKNDVNLLSNNIEEKVSDLVELSTIKYNYTNIVDYENTKKFSGINIPFTSKKFIVKYSGYIKAGMELDDIDIIVSDRETVRLKINKAEIMENVISEEDVYFYDEKDSVFNKLSYDNLYEVLIDEKEKMEKQVLKDGILNDAEKNGEKIIYSLLEGMGFEKITIEYKWIIEI